jgi:hypothetical protein
MVVGIGIKKTKNMMGLQLRETPRFVPPCTAKIIIMMMIIIK